MQTVERKQQILTNSGPTFVGYKILFDDFYEEIRFVFEEILTEKSEEAMEDFLRRVSNYVMRRLHNTLF